MVSTIRLTADLHLQVDRPGQAPVHAHLSGTAPDFRLTVDDPGAFAGTQDAPAIRAVAEALADHGLRLRVVDDEQDLIVLGDVRVGRWHRRLSRSRHIRVRGLRGLWTSGRSRFLRRPGSLLPDLRLLPPSTPLPLAPTFLRRRWQPITTTHDPARGGDPRLVLTGTTDSDQSLFREVHHLIDGTTTIGSDESCDIRLPGLLGRHAEVVHDERDELVVHARGGDVRVHGETVQTQLLRTGARVQVGEWILTYVREEYADHGRPYGGRLGGEIGHQRPQPPRDEDGPSSGTSH